MAHLWMYFLLKMMISHIYVPLPWGTYEYWMYDETPNPTYQLVTSYHPKCLGISGLFFPIFRDVPQGFSPNIIPKWRENCASSSPPAERATPRSAAPAASATLTGLREGSPKWRLRSGEITKQQWQYIGIYNMEYIIWDIIYIYMEHINGCVYIYMWNMSNLMNNISVWVT